LDGGVTDGTTPGAVKSADNKDQLRESLHITAITILPPSA